ncbi:maleylpyruvate isomerase family mycothiol-dependent enzyme [Blastococcus sp. BMG 814]|uniref:Maleylpyruvate isomerase family mycothiol-dependent enzyme n=1 Tax=Blastococcus carthaginiensis TaxID=3050034 RepID=A0ABT9I6F8_9ACTN|nr:maleylpyruvate isomerase family mycothiol-dependent enzyme [Blastococcus carthaginiensis]MDP5181143.1 maleylpyruvate isomerase family mycothiol-dependent enzyme [Blastococcus carthaginiensis]
MEETFAEIADERRELAALLSGLTAEQRATQSLCSEWIVHDVVAHLVVPLEVSTPTFLLAMLACRGNFDRANVRVAREQARRPFGELVEVLHRKAGSRFTPPGAGPEAPLTDLLVHGLDIRRPLGILRDIPEARLRTSLTFLTGGGFVPKGALDGLRFEAADLDWAHGSGPAVRGDADALLLALTGRTTALDHLDGDGVPVVRARLARPARRRGRGRGRGREERSPSER